MKQDLHAFRLDRLLLIVICDLSLSSNVKPLRVSEHQSIAARDPKIWGSIPHGDSEFFLCPRSWQDEKKHLSLLKVLFNASK